ncbi:hypothetical protein AX17_003077 [Amanita inopinata Kibby_2008]|nr:hypothetical protein AX17_003077 [Amanita inopinata Kibby_2008]
MSQVDILILGAGWVSTFLIPLCQERGLSFAATTRDGRNGTISFVFDPAVPGDDDGAEQYEKLPDAKTVLITFPIERSGASKKLVDLYRASRRRQRQTAQEAAFVQLGATSIWGGTSASSSDGSTVWCDRHSPYIPTARAVAEQELLDLSSTDVPTTVINLAGLWGGSRHMRNWVGRVAPTKEMLQKKGSIHLIHGLDVSRAILAIHSHFDKARGQRWIVTDGRVYDWWDLASAWGSKNPVAENPEPAGDDGGDGGSREACWVRELMRENGVRGLPRNVELLGRALDSRDFWETFGLSPVKTLLA